MQRSQMREKAPSGIKLIECIADDVSKEINVFDRLRALSQNELSDAQFMSEPAHAMQMRRDLLFSKG